MNKCSEKTAPCLAAGRNLPRRLPGWDRTIHRADSARVASIVRDNRPFTIFEFLLAGSKPTTARRATAQIAQVLAMKNATSFENFAPRPQICRRIKTHRRPPRNSAELARREVLPPDDNCPTTVLNKTASAGGQIDPLGPRSASGMPEVRPANTSKCFGQMPMFSHRDGNLCARRPAPMPEVAPARKERKTQNCPTKWPLSLTRRCWILCAPACRAARAPAEVALPAAGPESAKLSRETPFVVRPRATTCALAHTRAQRRGLPRAHHSADSLSRLTEADSGGTNASATAGLR